MLQAQVDLETLQFILSQFSEDITDDCSKIINKLLKALSVSMLHETKICNEKVFASIKVLLNLYESLNLNSANTESELPVNIIIECVKLIFQCSNETCNLPENAVQLNILSIISSVFKNGLLKNTSKSLEQLREFYDFIFTNLGTSITKKECKSDCLIYKLKIITLIYQSLEKTELESLNVGFSDKVKSVTDSTECELLADLAFHEDDEVAFQTLFHLIPSLTNCYKSSRAVKVIWKRISYSLSCDIMHSKVLIILCQIFNICFDKFIMKDRADLILLFFEDVNCWKLIQLALKDRDPVKRKQGLFLIKKAIDVLNIENQNLLGNNDNDNEKNIFYWHSDYKDELYKVYSEIIIILEFLEEQQIHIIKPIFKLIETVTEIILGSKKVNFSWILLAYEKALLHENLQVVKWALSNLMKLSENFFSDESIAKKTAELLGGILNNISLYFNNGLAISNELKAFLDNFTHLKTCKIFFSVFIKKICSQVWSAEALFFVIHSLSGKDLQSFCKYPFWKEDEITDITTFILKAFKTHNKIIRTGVQTELLNACLCLTDAKNVAMENFILLISIFFEREIVKVGSKNWDAVIYWLKVSYSAENAKEILEKYLMGKARNKPKYMSLMFILFYYAYDSNFFQLESNLEGLELDNGNRFALNYFQRILLSYKEIHKRPYSNKLIHDENLSIICNIYQANLKNSVPEFIKPTLPFLKDVILYIQTQLTQISGLQDFSKLELYLNTFEYIMKTLVLFKFHIDYVNQLYMEILEDLESFTQSDSNRCSIGMFWKMKFLNIMLELRFLEPKPSFLDSYLLEVVNEALIKDNDFSDNTRDLLILWGKLNSEFMELKWKILEYLVNNKLVVHGRVGNKSSCWISNNDLAGLCIEALNSGGYGVLCPVMSILKNLFPDMDSHLEVKKNIDSVWKLVLERKKTEEFKVFIKKFVEMVFQQSLIDKGEPTIQILLEYADIIFSDSSLAVVNIFMKHVQQQEITRSVPLFCVILGKSLIFGPVEKRDERLTKTVCSHIEVFKICNVQEISDYNTSNEIRARAVQKILQLDKKSPLHQAIAKKLIESLLKMENDLNKNRSRYFGNSHVHLVKHRLMQALLLLEPMLGENEDQAVELSKWIIHRLVSENSQPSVRYLQEWLLVRILVRHSEVYQLFNIFRYYNDSEETKKKGACSLIAVTYHLCRLIRPDLIETRIASDLSDILYFCFHRHFELRLYAQVVFLNFYDSFVKLKGLDNLMQQYERVYETLMEYFVEECKKNQNLRKLMNNFYFKDFHALNNYSLEMIYKDLPELTEVGSDEWISAEMFQYCGVTCNKIDVPLKGSNFPSKSTIKYMWLWKTFEPLIPTQSDDINSEKILDNFQKKITPIKPLIQSLNENSSCQNPIKNGGLIVVASLIDRIPNLGGLARTCEVFGASEYIINSLKHIENKQFTSLSVTAEKWITVKEVKVQNLLYYISEMKQNGYTVIGAEQALYSQPLNIVKFPKKSLILLGNEKEGIPPNLMPFLDVCVEIPQLGLIRSLNVHVTGALFIWEYAKQHSLS